MQETIDYNYTTRPMELAIKKKCKHVFVKKTVGKVTWQECIYCREVR